MKKSEAQRRNINRAEVVDQNFRDAVSHYKAQTGQILQIPHNDLLELFDSQMASRQIDLMARKLRLENKVFYTIGSSGHEGNALLGRMTQISDMALLHYRSGALMAERYRQKPEMDFIRDTALSFAASAEDPASGGRHKVWGNKALGVVPQTSTIASHLPKALGMAMAIEHGKKLHHNLPVDDGSIVLCSFGDASANHSTAQGAFNAVQWAGYQKLRVPLLFLCEDNGLGISVHTPENWIHHAFADRHGMEYVQVDGLDLNKGYPVVKELVDYCRASRKPVFLHMKTTRLMGHAGTDFELKYRDLNQLEQAESLDPLIVSAKLLMDAGLMDSVEILQRYDDLHQHCVDQANWADSRPRLSCMEQISEPLFRHNRQAVMKEARRTVASQSRETLWGGQAKLPEQQGQKHLAVLINQGLKDLMNKYPQSVVFGEDVARKGGVYTVTKGLFQDFGPKRIFNTLLDEQTILGLAQGYGAMGMLPIPEIQYLAYFHNACDQIRGEACSLQYFSNGDFSNPLLMRIASLGYQKGFGGHFHNDNSIAALRDIPGLVVACPSRGDDAVKMLRTALAMNQIDGRVVAFLEPIALYMHKDLYEEGDNLWCFNYPDESEAIEPGEPRRYFPDANQLLMISYGNGIPMSLKVAKRLENEGIEAGVLDLRWLQPLDFDLILPHVKQAEQVLIVDEGRATGGISEGLIAGMIDHHIPVRMARVTGEDCYTPLGDAAKLLLPDEETIYQKAKTLLEKQH